MAESKGQVGGSAAEVYEEFFIPALFGQWPPRVADTACLASGQLVLDVACGTGALAREAARRVGCEAVTGVDCNEGMLAVARKIEPDITWQLGRAEQLPFPDEHFHAVVSQFGLMFFEDRERAIRQMWRVLRPHGYLVVAVFGPLELSPGYADMVVLLERLFGPDIAGELRAPFSLGEATTLRALFASAGIEKLAVTTVAGKARFPSLADWVHTDIRGWTLADKIDDEQYELLAREADVALRPHVTEDGRVEFDSPAYIVSARKES